MRLRMTDNKSDADGVGLSFLRGYSRYHRGFENRGGCRRKSAKESFPEQQSEAGGQSPGPTVPGVGHFDPDERFGGSSTNHDHRQLHAPDMAPRGNGVRHSILSRKPTADQRSPYR